MISLSKHIHKALADSGSWILAVAIGACLPAASQSANSVANESSPGLTNAAQVLRLTPDQAGSNLPVLIQGVVTCYDHGNLLFVQDETAGIYVHYVGDRLTLASGQHIQVSGTAQMGLYSPVIIPSSIVMQDSGPTIKPLPVSIAQIQYGSLDEQWVEVTGVVREENAVGQHLELQLADAANRIRLWIIDSHGGEKQRFRGSRVRARGVVGARVNSHRQLEGFQIYANSTSDLTVLTRSAEQEPFAAPRCQVGDLQRQGLRIGEPRMVTLRGVVTFHQSGRGLFIQDATGGAEVIAQTTLENWAPGDTVEVAGYPGPILEPTRLEDALIRKVEFSMVPQPLATSPADFLQLHHANQLIEIVGIYLGRAQGASNSISLALQVGDQHLTALLDTLQLPKIVVDLKPGSTLQLTGVFRSPTDAGGLSAQSLLLRSAADIKVVGTPPSPQETKMILLTGAALLSGIALIALLWFVRSQRHRIEHALKLQVALQTEMRQNEQQLRRSVEERERIGRDLHDDIIQSIYAAGLSLEDSRRLLRQSPDQAETRLAAAINTLNDTIRSVRGFIAGLEPKVLNGRELKTALKSLALTSADGPTPFQFNVEPKAANSLTSTQATQLLHIAKEAMSNSVRHAHASHVTVSLQMIDEGIQLEIVDDGIGFAPDVPTGRGLGNMAARAREIGGHLRTISSPGQGCRILIVVPQPNTATHD